MSHTCHHTSVMLNTQKQPCSLTSDFHFFGCRYVLILIVFFIIFILRSKSLFLKILYNKKPAKCLIIARLSFKACLLLERIKLLRASEKSQTQYFKNLFLFKYHSHKKRKRFCNNWIYCAIIGEKFNKKYEDKKNISAEHIF